MLDRITYPYIDLDVVCQYSAKEQRRIHVLADEAGRKPQ